MDTATLTIIGIVVTLITFGIVYWKTTSARKERERHAHKDIVAVLARLLAEGQDSLDLSIVESLMNSKAREHNVNFSIVDEMPRISEDLATKFAESEFITSESRQELIRKALLLKQDFERKEMRIEEATAEVQRSTQLSRLKHNIIISAIGALIAGVAAWIIIIYLMAPSPTMISILPYYTTGMVVIVIIVSSLVYAGSSKESKEKEDRSSMYLGKALEKIVSDELGSLSPSASIDRNVRIRKDDYYIEVDFVIQTNEERIPVEIKAQTVRRKDIDYVVAAMKEMASKRGILITSTQVQNRIAKIAHVNNIILLAGIASKEDLHNSLKNLKIVS